MVTISLTRHRHISTFDERKMKTIQTILIASLIALSGCATNPNELAPLSSVNATATEGTLTNHVLAQDASLAIRKIMNGNKKVTKFVLQQPVGPAGSKAWREMWVYDADGASQMFIMTFKEDGQGSADFEIERMSN
jgi:hypothetical protein